MIFTLAAPARHNDVIDYMVERCGIGPPINREHGFILEDGQFVNRIQARMIADEADQLLARTGDSPRLFSEDLW